MTLTTTKHLTLVLNRLRANLARINGIKSPWAEQVESAFLSTIAAIDLLDTTPHGQNCISRHVYFTAAKRAEQELVGCDCERTAKVNSLLSHWPLTMFSPEELEAVEGLG